MLLYMEKHRVNNCSDACSRRLVPSNTDWLRSSAHPQGFVRPPFIQLNCRTQGERLGLIHPGANPRQRWFYQFLLCLCSVAPFLQYSGHGIVCLHQHFIVAPILASFQILWLYIGCPHRIFQIMANAILIYALSRYARCYSPL